MLHAINAAGHRQSQGLLRPSKQRLILIAAGFVILAETTIVFMTVRVAYWWADDFINFDLAREMGLTWKYLSRSLFGHFAPLYQLTYYVLLQTRPFDHGAVAIIETFLYLTSNVLLFRLLQLLFGQRWLNVVLTGLFGASILHLTSLLWWASGLLIFTTVPLSLICLGGFLKYQATGAKKHLVASVAAFTAGLGFYEPIMVVLGELVLVAALYFSPTASPFDILRTLAKRWRIWLCYLVPIAADLSYRTIHSQRFAGPRPPSWKTLVRYIGIAWAQGFMPAIIGFNYPSRLIASSKVITIILAQGFFAMLVIASLRKSRGGWRAWIFFSLPMGASLLAAGWTRSGLFGPSIGLYYQYLAYGPYLLVLAVGLAFSPLSPYLQTSLGKEPIVNPSHSKAPWARNALGILAVTALSTAYLTQTVSSGKSMIGSSGPHSTRGFVQNFGRSLSRSRQVHDQPFLFDDEASELVPAVFYPYDKYSRTLGAIDRSISFNSASGHGYLVDKKGHLVTAAFAAETEARPDESAVDINPSIDDSDPSRGRCFATSPEKETLTTALRAPVRPAHWFLRISYRNEGPPVAVKLTLGFKKIPRPAKGDNPAGILRTGEGTLLTDLDPGPIDQVLLTLPARTSICLLKVEIGRPNPQT